MLSQGDRGGCDTQGGHDVGDGHPGHDPQQDDLTRREDPEMRMNTSGGAGARRESLSIATSDPDRVPQ
jgi:hypothetical protein